MVRNVKYSLHAWVVKATKVCFMISISLLQGNSQRVTVSEELPIRNDISYELLGLLDDRVLLYRDRGNEHILEVFSDDMKFLYERELHLDSKRSDVHGIVKKDDHFILFSSFREKGLYTLAVHKFDKEGDPLDTAYIIDAEEEFKSKTFTFCTSDDKSKTMFYAGTNDKLFHLFVVDNDSLSLLWRQDILVADFDVRRDFQHAFITNQGEANVLFYDEGKESEKEEPQFMLIGASASGDVYMNQFIVDKKYVVDVECRYDNKNNSFIIAGLASDEREFDADAYFFLSKKLTALQEVNTVGHRNFDATFIEEVYGKKLGRKKRLDDFVTRDVIVRNDGGIILVTEMEKEFYRRSSFNSIGRNTETYGRGWVDIYTEDIILVAINPDGTEDWKKILYKKQFSQDDGGVFSSFFIFKNPSRLRLIYNDEIKNNITVSEYVLNPLGKHERNSLLSTQYQNLKIRWRHGVQISPSAMIAPSEQNFKLSLVKVDYSANS